MSIDVYRGENHSAISEYQYIIYLNDLDESFKGKGSLQTFPGCCGYALYVSVGIEMIEHATKIIKDILWDNREDRWGFGAVLCTVTRSYLCEKLEENGWEKIEEHLNPGTGNTIYTYLLKGEE